MDERHPRDDDGDQQGRPGERGTDGSGEPPKRNPVRRAFSAEYKLAILAEYDA